MRPRGDELIASARWTLEEYVQPILADPLAASYLRAVIALLFQAEARAAVEWPVLLEELEDLRSILPGLRDRADDRLGTAIDQALDAGGGFDVSKADLAALTDHVMTLREPVGVAVRETLEGPSVEVRGYLVRQLEREARCVPPLRGPMF